MPSYFDHADCGHRHTEPSDGEFCHTAECSPECPGCEWDRAQALSARFPIRELVEEPEEVVEDFSHLDYDGRAWTR